jgi:hypothetical protein
MRTMPININSLLLRSVHFRRFSFLLVISVRHACIRVRGLYPSIFKILFHRSSSCILFPFDLYAVAGTSTSHGMNFMKIATLPLSVVHPFTFSLSHHLPTHIHSPLHTCLTPSSFSCHYLILLWVSIHFMYFCLFYLSWFRPYSCYPGAISISFWWGGLFPAST